MPDTGTQTATPPANSGGITIEQIKQMLTESVQPLTDKIAELETNLGVVAQTVAEQPTDKATGAKKDENKVAVKDEGKDAAASSGTPAEKPLTAADIARVVAAEVAKAIKPAEVTDAGGKTPAKPTAAAVKLPGTASDGGTTPANQPVDYSKLSAAKKVELGIAQAIKQTP